MNRTGDGRVYARDIVQDVQQPRDFGWQVVDPGFHIMHCGARVENFDMFH